MFQLCIYLNIKKNAAFCFWLSLSAEFNCVMWLAFTYTLQLIERFATEVLNSFYVASLDRCGLWLSHHGAV